MALPVVTIMGATASGKTRLAMALYQKNPQLYHLISVDSALIYRDMDIGTAKPTAQELERAPHELVSFLDPVESYSVGNFLEDVDRLIQEIHAQNKIPVLVGGTMMYYRSLLGELDALPSSTEASRAWVVKLQEERGNEYCHSLLRTIDPPAFHRLHPNDAQRVGRVLEVWYLTGKGVSEISQNNSSVNKHLKPLEKHQRLKAINKKLYNTAKYDLEDYLFDLENITPEQCLAPHDAQGTYYFHDAKGKTLTSRYNLVQFAMYNEDRAALHWDIENRLNNMVKDGFVEEVRKLYERGDLHIEMPSVRCVGYRQLWPYFAGEQTLEEAVEQVLFATRQLAKRQITWLRSWPLPFTQINTTISVEQQIAVIEKVLRLALQAENSPLVELLPAQ